MRPAWSVQVFDCISFDEPLTNIGSTQGQFALCPQSCEMQFVIVTCPYNLPIISTELFLPCLVIDRDRMRFLRTTGLLGQLEFKQVRQLSGPTCRSTSPARL